MVKDLSSNAEDSDSILGSGRSPGEGSGNSLQYSCQGNSMDRGAWRATVHGVTESDMTERLTHSLMVYLGIMSHGCLKSTCILLLLDGVVHKC